MPRRPRRNHSPVFKSKVAVAAIKGDCTSSEHMAPLELFSKRHFSAYVFSSLCDVSPYRTTIPPTLNLPYLHDH